MPFITVSEPDNAVYHRLLTAYRCSGASKIEEWSTASLDFGNGAALVSLKESYSPWDSISIMPPWVLRHSH